MGIGNYKQIKIVSYAPVKDGNGDNVETARAVYYGYAEVQNISGSRRFSDMPINTKVMRFTLRQRPGISFGLNDVVVYDGRKHTIQDVRKTEEKNFKYEITAISN